MSVLATDTFNRADGAIGANWTVDKGSWNVSGNKAVPGSFTFPDSAARYTGVATPSADHYAKVKVTVTGTNGGDAGIGVCVRAALNGATFNGYTLVADHAASNNVGLFKNTGAGGTYAHLASATQAFTDGDTFELRAVGTSLSVYYNGSILSAMTTTDSSLSAGTFGIYMSTVETSASIDDWEGGDFTGGNLTPAIPAGSLVMAGLALSAMLGVQLALPAGALAFTGQAPTIAVTGSTSIIVPAGVLGFTSNAPTVLIDKSIAIPAGSLLHTGQYVAIAFGGELAAGQVTFTGYAPSLTVGGILTFAMPAGVVTWHGLAPTVDAGGAISLPAGVLTFTSTAPTIDWGVGLPAGFLAFTGQAPVSSVRMNIDIPAGNLVLAGQTLAPDAPKALAIPAGTLTFTGRAITVNNSGVGSRSPQNRGRGRAR